MINFIPVEHGKIQIVTLTHGYQDRLDLDVFQNVMSKLVQCMGCIETINYLDDLFILTNSSSKVKDHVLKLGIVLSRISTSGMRMNVLYFLI
jgi:hypothetical protein